MADQIPGQMIYHQAIKLPYRYTAGDMQRSFLKGLQARTILGARCGTCEQTVAPARPFCPRCSAKLSDTVEVGPGGTVTTWTTDGSGRTFARIRLDGADTDMLHRVDGVVETGARVTPRWASEREAEITAIETFVVE